MTRSGWYSLALVCAAVPATVVAISAGGRVAPIHALGAMATLFVAGYVPGRLLVTWTDERAPLSWALMRTIAGLMLSGLGFLVSLVLGVPWFIVPAATILAAVARYRFDALVLPPARISLHVDALLAMLVVTVLVWPVLLSSVLMAPGEYPPIFFNADTPYFLEKVHALVHATTYPPASLSNAGVLQPNHFGIHAVCALVSRVTGMTPHHATFLVVVPLLCLGMICAAFLVGAEMEGRVPKVLAVPLLLAPVPSFWYGFWAGAWPVVRKAVTSRAMAPLEAFTRDVQIWGPASIVATNVGATFITVATLAAVAVTPVRGWRLAVFLVGTALVFKVPAGIALVAGFALAQTYRAWFTRRLDPLTPVAAVLLIAGATYVGLFALHAAPAGIAIKLAPFFHLSGVADHDGLTGLAMDAVWIFLPALIALTARRRDELHMSTSAAVSLLLFGLAPLIVVNLTELSDTRPGGGRASDDWRQILLTAPIILHAFVLALVGDRWTSLGRLRRGAVAVLIAAAAWPPAVVAGRYAHVLLSDSTNGHDFADNRLIGDALAHIPRQGTLLVTNDLRYPADGFARDNRQMQIPALFGHQAFAVNYTYEVFEDADERRQLQALLRSTQWTREIDAAADRYDWTHLLIHKRYAHPEPIPLEKIFENEAYAVFRFDGQGG